MRLEALAAPQRAPAGEPVEAWLRVLKSLLHLPEAQAAGICEELESHLRDRIRDLQVGGMSESEAIRTAIGELGDAAALAGRYRLANRWKYRRLTMNIAVALVAGGAAVLSLVAVSQSSQLGQAKQEAHIARAEAESAHAHTNELLQVVPLLGSLPVLGKEPEAFQSVDDRRLVVNIGETPRTIRLDELLAAVAGELELPLHVHWNRLEEYGLTGEHEVRLGGGDLDVAALFRRINESLPDIVALLDYRIDRGVMEVAERRFFDKRELKLVTYDIGPLLAAGHDRFAQARHEVITELLSTLHQFVSPEDWTDNGGDLASEAVVGDRLFVEAPPRMHRQIEWILDQLKSGVPMGDAGPDAPLVQAYPLAHAEATAALKVLRTLEPIREIDFTRFTSDERTNSIVGSASPSDHLKVRGALAVLDKPADR